MSTMRSVASRTLPATMVGMAKRIMKEVTRVAQTKSGMRLSDMPGARVLRMVTMASTAATSAETSTKVMMVA